MSIGRVARRIVGGVVHNWPLKLAALVLATLLYVGLVATQDSNTYPGPIRVDAINLPAGTVVTNQLRTVDEVKYVAPADLGRLTAQDFKATVDLADVPPTGTPTSVRVVVEAIDPRVTIIDTVPRSIPVVLDQSISNTVPVRVNRGTAPARRRRRARPPTRPQQVTVTGASTAVQEGCRGRGQRVDRLEWHRRRPRGRGDAGRRVGRGGHRREPVAPDGPRHDPLYTNKQSQDRARQPGAHRDASPRLPGGERRGHARSRSTLEGDANELATLTSADTASIQIEGATRTVSETVALACRPG